MKRMTTAAVAALVTANLAQAQEAGLTEDQVRGFFDDMQTQMEQSVAAGEWKGVQSWMAAHVAEGASLAFSGVVNMREGPVVSYAVTFDADDLTGAHGMGMMGHQMLQAVADYALATEVHEVAGLPNGETSVQVSFRETGTFARPEGGGGAAAAERAAAATGDGLTIVSVSDCDLRLSGSASDPKIEIASCMTSTTL